MNRGTCFYCQKTLPTVNALCEHLCQAHEEAQTSKFRCGEKFCLSSYNDIDTFKRHLRNKHEIPNVFKRDSEATTNSQAFTSGASPMLIDESEVDDPERCENEDDLNNFKDALFKKAEVFVAKQYAKPSLPRSHVQNVMNDVMLLLTGSFGLLRDKLKDLVSSCPDGTACEIEGMLEVLSDPFNGLHTEYKRLQHFEESGSYIKPVSVKIGERFERRSNPDGNALGIYVDVHAQFIPPSQVLKHFLEMSDVFEVIMTEMERLKRSDLYTNIVQSPMWKQKVRRYKSTDIVLPFDMYGDDFEPNDDLGPHSGKLGAIYGSIPILPSECRSRLENIFLFMLYESADRTTYGNAAVFTELIRDINRLQREGITLNLPTGEKKVYFVLTRILDDNLALHQLLHFIEGFNAKYVCRFCKIHRDLLKTLTSDEGVQLWNKESYEADLLVNDQSKTGIASDSVFNSIDFFHVTENFTVDILHDLFEGTCDVMMLFILNHFVKACKPPRFTIETLNFRMDLFTWGPLVRNKPSLFGTCLGSDRLKMTGCEKLTFVKLFGVIIGDLVDVGDEHWELYLSLRKVIEIAMSEIVTDETSEVLRVHVESLLKLYLSLNSTNYLRPKTHWLTHYHRIMQQNGCLKNLNCLRYESKHKELKASSSATTSRVNLPMTVAIKHQLNMSFRFKCNQSVLPATESGPGHIVKIQEDEQYFLFRDTLPLSILQADGKCYATSYVEFKGTVYSSPMMLFVDVDEFGSPCFPQIKSVLIHNGLIVFVCQKFLTIGFDEHVLAHKVVPYYEWQCFTPNDLVAPLPYYAHENVHKELRIVM